MIKIFLSIIFALFIYDIVKYLIKIYNIRNNDKKLLRRIKKMREQVNTVSPIGIGIMKRVDDKLKK